MSTTETHGWNSERIELLKKLWAEGHSASRIAARLDGLTRSAVIGKVHRLRLPGRATTTRLSTPKVIFRRAALPLNPRMTDNPTHRLRKIDDIRKHSDWVKAPPAPKLAPEPLPILDDESGAGGGGVSLLDLQTGMCKWAYGETPPYTFCGAKCTSGSWCPQHEARVYVVARRTTGKPFIMEDRRAAA